MSTTINLDYLRKVGAIIKLQGREYTTHQGLLHVAHEQGLQSLHVEIVSWDGEKRQAVCKATAHGARGSFSDIGDASPSNVGKLIASACLRMASTRASSRVLRLYLGVGMTCLEELPAKEEKEERAPAPKKAAPPKRQQAADTADAPLKEWTDKQRKTFMGRIGQPDIDCGGKGGYEAVKKMCELMGAPSPSRMNEDRRKRFIAFCLTEAGKLKLSDAYAVIDYHTHGLSQDKEGAA